MHVLFCLHVHQLRFIASDTFRVARNWGTHDRQIHLSPHILNINKINILILLKNNKPTILHGAISHTVWSWVTRASGHPIREEAREAPILEVSLPCWDSKLRRDHLNFCLLCGCSFLLYSMVNCWSGLKSSQHSCCILITIGLLLGNKYIHACHLSLNDTEIQSSSTAWIFCFVCLLF